MRIKYRILLLNMNTNIIRGENASCEAYRCSVGHEFTIRFITLFTKHAIGSYPEPVESTTQFHVLISSSILMLKSCHICIGLPNGFTLSGLSSEILYTFLVSPCVLHVPAVISFLVDECNNVWWRIHIMWFYPFSNYFLVLDPAVLLNTLFSDIFILCFPLRLEPK